MIGGFIVVSDGEVHASRGDLVNDFSMMRVERKYSRLSFLLSNFR